MFKMKGKKIIALVMAVTLGVGLAACGTKTNNSGNNTGAEATVDKEKVIYFPSFWVGKDSKATVMNEIITKFNEDNAGKIKVVVEEIADYNAYEDKMKTNIAAGTVPDIFIFKSGTQAEPYYKSGKLMDLTSYMNEGWKDSFITEAITEATYDSKVQAVPYEYGVTPVLYNAEQLKAAGYDSFPKTYTEFFEMCDKLKANGVDPLSQMTGDNAWTSMLWYSQLVVAIGGPDVYADGLDNPAFVEAAEVMKKMFEYTTSDAVGANAAVASGHFLTGKTNMLMNGPWFIGRIKSEGAEGLYDNVQAAPAPVYEGGKGEEGGYIGFVQSLIGAAQQEDPAKEAAVIEFLKVLTDPENVKKLSISAGSMFVVKTEYTDADEVDRIQKQMIDQTNAAPYIAPHFAMSVASGVATEFPQALSSLVLGETTAEEFVAALKAAE